MKDDPTRNERQRRWYYAHREHKNGLTRAEYYRRVAAGQCISCDAPARKGRVRCQACADKR